jgi:hypothetical protein
MQNVLTNSKEARINLSSINNSSNKSGCLSNAFKYVSSGTWNVDSVGIFAFAGNGLQQLAFRIPSNENTTYFDTHFTYIYYELATYSTTRIDGYSYDSYEYEEYKNNTTLIDLAENELTGNDEIVIRDNQVILIKNGALDEADYKYVLLGNVPMPRTYTPWTSAYCHQRTYIKFEYRDQRNIDMTKIDFAGMLSIDKIEVDSVTINGASVEETISTDNEIATTTFLNGKRVYKRLFTGTMPSTTNSSTQLFAFSFTPYNVWIDKSLSYITDGNEYLDVNYHFTSGSDLSTWVNKTSKNVKFNSGTNMSSYSYHIVLAYTKDDGGNTEEGGDTPNTPISYQSKTISANGSKGHHKFTLQVNEDGISGKASTINYSFKLSPIQKGWDWSGWGESISYTITIGSNTYKGSIPKYDGSSTVTLKSESGIKIEHESNGTKTISIGFTVTDGAGKTYTCGNASSSASMTLSTIQ